MYLQSVQTEVDNVTTSTATNISFDVPDIDGYRPLLAIYQSNNASSNILPMSASALINNGKAAFSVKNISTAAITNVTFWALILYTR